MCGRKKSGDGDREDPDLSEGGGVECNIGIYGMGKYVRVERLTFARYFLPSSNF